MFNYFVYTEHLLRIMTLEFDFGSLYFIFKPISTNYFMKQMLSMTKERKMDEWMDGLIAGRFNCFISCWEWSKTNDAIHAWGYCQQSVRYAVFVFLWMCCCASWVNIFNNLSLSRLMDSKQFKEGIVQKSIFWSFYLVIISCCFD